MLPDGHMGAIPIQAVAPDQTHGNMLETTPLLTLSLSSIIQTTSSSAYFLLVRATI